MDWYIQVWKKYAVFSGRARRKEYWCFGILNALILIGLLVIAKTAIRDDVHPIFFLLLFLAYCLAALIPSFAVSVRRLHDIDLSGWFVLFAFVPLLGAIILFILHVIDSNRGVNSYGPNPKITPVSLNSR